MMKKVNLKIPAQHTLGFREKIRPYIENELALSQQCEWAGELKQAFTHLERAHVLGQQDTYWHVRIHREMLRFAQKRGDTREIAGQVLRIVGAASKTPLGIYPTGYTGGANINPIKPLPIPENLQQMIDTAKNTSLEET